jgi:hypothetical protein
MTADFRIESSQPISKATATPPGGSSAEIRVVHVPTGEVVFRKPAAQRAEWADD